MTVTPRVGVACGGDVTVEPGVSVAVGRGCTPTQPVVTTMTNQSVITGRPSSEAEELHNREPVERFIAKLTLPSNHTESA